MKSYKEFLSVNEAVNIDIINGYIKNIKSTEKNLVAVSKNLYKASFKWKVSVGKDGTVTVESSPEDTKVPGIKSFYLVGAGKYKASKSSAEIKVNSMVTTTAGKEVKIHDFTIKIFPGGIVDII